MEDPQTLKQKETFALEVQLASVLLEPLKIVSDSHCHIQPLEAMKVRAIAGHPKFMMPVNRAIARKLGLDQFSFPAELLARIQHSNRSRLAVLMLCAPFDVLDDAARHLAATILQKRVSHIVLKTRRDIVRLIMGDAAYNTAIREAAVLYGPMTLLDDRSSNHWLDDPEGSQDDARSQFVMFGRRAMFGYINETERSLAELFRLRLSGESSGDLGLSVSPYDEIMCAQVLKLMRRKVPAWSTYLA